MTVRWFLTAVLATTALLAIAVVDTDQDTPSGATSLPDLWSSAPFEVQLATLDGRDVLRFTTEINNLGPGAFMIRGNTRDGRLTQKIVHADAGHSEVPIDVSAVWSGDTHFHWHVAGVARYWIERADGTPAGDRFDNKVGFCFFDGVDRLSELPTAPTEPVHAESGCGTRLDPVIDMGLSVGWGDQYRFDLVGQYIDIGDLPPGRYRLLAQVDPDGRFMEADTTNNTAATEFAIVVDANGLRTIEVAS